MGLISWLKGEKRATAKDANFWRQFYEVFQMSASGKVVNGDTAMRQSTVYACVQIHSETLASLPLFIYRKKADGSKMPATRRPIYRLLHEQPNPFWSIYDFKEYLRRSVLLRGNAFCWREYNNAGEIMALWPLDTNNMEWDIGVNSKGARRIVQYAYTTPEDGKRVLFNPEEIWHLKGPIGPDGVSGMTGIEMCKDTIGLAMAADEYGSKFFANDATPAGILKYPGFLEEGQRKQVVKSWDEIHKGSQKAFKTALLEGNIDFTPITMKNEDAQFIQTRSFQVADICRIFRVPTIMVGGAGDSDKSNTFASAEQQMLSFVQNTIRPSAIQFEQNINVNLLDDKERTNHFAEFKLDALLRGDFKTRMEGYKIGREIGIFSVDEIRAKENMEPLGKEDGGEDHIMPMNFKKLNEETPAPEPIQGNLPIDDEPSEDDTGDEEDV